MKRILRNARALYVTALVFGAVGPVYGDAVVAVDEEARQAAIAQAIKKPLTKTAVGIATGIAAALGTATDVEMPDSKPVDETDDGGTCADRHPELSECFEYEDRSRLPFPDREAAVAALQKFFSNTKLTTADGREGADSDQCEGGQGKHWNYKMSNGKFAGSVLCCQCCSNTAKEPVLGERCGVFPDSDKQPNPKKSRKSR